jgi:hypothetical protein
MALLAIAALYSGTRSRPWAKAALAGMAAGFGVVEAFDVGAIYSLYVAAFAIFQAFNREGTQQRVKGMLLVAVVAVAAACLAAQALTTLIGTQVKGVVGMEQTAEAKAKRWDEATAWSLPKQETLRVIIPGLFGYRMDTPEGGAYWGAVGYPAYQRHSGAGEYAGILVVLVAMIGVANAFRKQNNLYSPFDRRVVIFWTIAAVVSILFAWGRWAPFYQILYKLPFFSTIRNPIKFMHFFHLSLLILFGYGLQVILGYYVNVAAAKSGNPMEQFRTWWGKAASFDRKTILALGAGLAISLLGFFMYSGSKGDVAKYLETVGFPAPANAEIAAFSLGEVGLYLVFYTLSLAAILLCLCGFFGGARSRWAAVIIGAVLVIDMARANKPWIVYLDYKDRYVENGVFTFLRKDALEHRVTSRIVPFRGGALLSQQFNFMQGVFSEWLQNQFQYFNIQSVDIIQMPRVPELDDRYNKQFMPSGESLQACARLWELSNTRYLLGQREYLQELNRAFDPQLQRFRIATNFDFAPKPGRATGAGLSLEDLHWELKPDGKFSIFEFTGALPRYKLYSQWQKVDDAAALGVLASPAFDPQQKLLVNEDVPAATSSGSTNVGTVTVASYAPKKIEVKTETAAPSILLWNDRWSPNWRAFVDGQEVKLLRCNYIMRGIQVPAGTHKIEMRYSQPARMLWVSFATLAVGIALCGFLAFDSRKQRQA